MFTIEYKQLAAIRATFTNAATRALLLLMTLLFIGVLTLLLARVDIAPDIAVANILLIFALTISLYFQRIGMQAIGVGILVIPFYALSLYDVYTYGVSALSMSSLQLVVTLTMITIYPKRIRHSLTLFNVLLYLTIVGGHYIFKQSVDSSAMWILAATTITMIDIGIVIAGISTLNGMVESLATTLSERKRIFENTGVGMFRSQVDGKKPLIVNQAFADILGTTIEHALKCDPLQFWRWPEERIQLVRELSEKGYSKDFVSETICADGSTKYLLLNTILTSNNEINGSVVDITAQIRRENKLRSAINIAAKDIANA